MADLGRILIADNDRAFLQSNADLLCRQGYHCDCVSDAAEAAKMLKTGEYALLIAGVDMPGNTELELVRDMSTLAKDVPVILVTAYPSLDSAIRSIELPVQSYLVKPVAFEHLLANVRTAIEHFQLFRSVRSIKQRLQYWYKGLAAVEELLKDKSRNSFLLSVDTFLELTFQNIVVALADIKHLTGALAGQTQEKDLCHLFNCPRLQSLAAGLAETIDVLEKSKSAFKSKGLGQTRKKLEALLTDEIENKAVTKGKN